MSGILAMLEEEMTADGLIHFFKDRIIANSNDDGVVETYFDPTGERSGIVDPVVCANVL